MGIVVRVEDGYDIGIGLQGEKVVEVVGFRFRARDFQDAEVTFPKSEILQRSFQRLDGMWRIIDEIDSDSMPRVLDFVQRIVNPIHDDVLLIGKIGNLHSDQFPVTTLVGRIAYNQ